jgi:hypothetical protein
MADQTAQQHYLIHQSNTTFYGLISIVDDPHFEICDCGLHPEYGPHYKVREPKK